MAAITYVDCNLAILDEKTTEYWDTFRSSDRVTGRIRDDQNGDSLLRDTIERLHAWVASDDRNITREDLELLGRHLYYYLFDETIRKGFEQSYQGFRATANPNHRLRLVLAFHEEAKRLASYPWEFLFMPKRGSEPGFFLSAEKRTELILTRFVPRSSLEDRLRPEEANLEPEEAKLKILVVFANPRELQTPLDPDKFLEQITEMKWADVRIVTHKTKPEALTKDGLRGEIADFKPHILHFIGHGDAEKGIALMKPPEEIEQYYAETGEMKDAEWVDSRSLNTLFSEPRPRLVFLHACEGAGASSMTGFNSTAQTLVYSYKVPAVVAMQYVISNEAAALFATTFYQQLSGGATIDIAVSEGRWALRQSRRGEFADRGFGTPLVYLQTDNADHAIVVHKLEEEGSRPLPDPCPYGCGAWVVAGNPRCGQCQRPLTTCELGHAMVAGDKLCPEGHPAVDAAVMHAASSSDRPDSQVETGRAGTAPVLQPVTEPSASDPFREATTRAGGGATGER